MAQDQSRQDKTGLNHESDRPLDGDASFNNESTQDKTKGQGNDKHSDINHRKKNKSQKHTNKNEPQYIEIPKGSKEQTSKLMSDTKQDLAKNQVAKKQVEKKEVKNKQGDTKLVGKERVEDDSLESQVDHKSKVKSSAGRTVVSLIVITALTKVFGFLREILFGRWYGVEEVAEAFKIAQTIPMLLLLIVGTGISTGFIPIYTGLERRRGRKAADEFMSNLINVLVVASLAFSLFVTFFPGIFVKLFASGYTGSKYDLTVLYTQIAVWGTLFNMATYVMAPYLQLNNQYMAPALMVIPGNLVFILCFYLGRTMDPIIVGLSIVLAIVVQFLWLIPFVKKFKYKYSFKLDFNDPSLRRFFILAVPVVIGVAVNQVNIMVDKNIASNTLDGGVAILDYANRMTSFVQAIFIYPVAAVFFPNMTRYIIDKDFRKAKESTINSLISLAIIVIPCAAGLMIFAQPIIDLLFGGDAFTPDAVARTGQAMFWYATGLFFYAWRDIMVRVYYAFGNTKTPTINAIIGVTVNIAFNLILSRYIGLNGLAMATSISGAVSCLLMMRGIQNQSGFDLDYRLLMGRVGKIVLAALAMSGGALFAYNFLLVRISSTLSLLVGIMVAVTVYGVSILALRIPEVNQTIRLVLKRGAEKNKH